eukprot:503943-Prymnesium_polylepis.1
MHEWAGPIRGAEGTGRANAATALRARRTVSPARKPQGPPSRSPAACAQADGSAASASLLWDEPDEPGRWRTQAGERGLSALTIGLLSAAQAGAD